MKFMYFSIKYSDILLKKKLTSFITVRFTAITLVIVLVCGFCDVSVTSSDYPKLISRINEVYVFFNKIKRYFIEKKT